MVSLKRLMTSDVTLSKEVADGVVEGIGVRAMLMDISYLFLASKTS